jgi:hypothetical protein
MTEQEQKAFKVSPLLVILIVIAAGLGVVFAFRASAPPASPMDFVDDDTEPKVPELKEISQYPLDGEPPEEPPEFDVQAEVDTSEGKNRMVIYLTETHGYYVEMPVVRFWWKGNDPDLERDDSVFSFVYRPNNYIKANETFKDCFEVTGPELRAATGLADGEIGTTENWGWQLEGYFRARPENPEKFPPVSDVGRYCSD